MPSEFSMLHPHFTPEIHLGHLVQAVVIVTTSAAPFWADF